MSMRIDDICTYAPKSGIKAGEATKDGQYMFFTSSEDESKRYTDYQYDGEGIIMGTGGNATLHYYHGKYAVSTDCIVLNPDDRIRCKYLYYFFRANMPILEAGFKGAGLKHTNKKYIGSITIPKIPPVDEQDRVIEVLDKISGIINTRNLEIAALDDIIKARFVEVFGSQEDNPLRFNIGTLKDVADIYLGLTHTPTYVTEGKPFLSVRDISSGRIDFANCHYISEQEFASLPNGARPKPNDILFCRVGTIGKPVTIPEGTPEFGSFVSVGFLRKKRNVLNEYLKAWMEDPYFMKQVYDNVAGASQINLNTGWLKNFRILIPPIELQQQFASFGSQVDKSKVVVRKALDETRLLFDSLMQQYFG